MAGGERSVIVSGRSTAGNGVGRINQRFLRFGRRAGTLKREGSGRFGLAEILSVLFFPNSVGSPRAPHHQSAPRRDDYQVPDQADDGQPPLCQDRCRVI